VHQVIRIPSEFCPDYAKRNGSCSGEQQCGLTHGTWPIIIESINSGQSKQAHTVAAVTEETQYLHTAKGRDRSQRAGKGKGGRGRDQDPSVGRGKGKGKGDGGSGGKRPRSSTPGARDGSGPICSRCKNPGHTQKQCYATFDIDGNPISSDKPAEVPDYTGKTKVTF